MHMDRKGIVVQLGGGVWMQDSIRQIQALGYAVHCLDVNPNAPAFAVADAHAVITISDVEGVMEYAHRVGADVVLALNDLGVLPAATYNRSIGLDCYDPGEVKYFTDKGHMRDRWREFGVAQPKYQICDSRDSMIWAISEIGFPCIVKPCMMWESRGVSKVNGPADIEFAVAFAMENARGPRYIVEECMLGVEVSVEGLFQAGEAHILAKADKELQQHDQYRVTVQINYQANLPDNTMHEIDALVAQAGRAMGFRSGALHAECMVTSEGVKMIEMAGRPGGGHIFGSIVEAVSGISMPQALTRILLGEQVDLTPKKQGGACYRFFNAPEGVFVAVRDLDQAKQVRGVLDMGFHLESGTRITTMNHGANRPGFVVTAGANRAEAIAIAEQAYRTLRFEMK